MLRVVSADRSGPSREPKRSRELHAEEALVRPARGPAVTLFWTDPSGDKGPRGKGQGHEGVREIRITSDRGRRARLDCGARGARNVHARRLRRKQLHNRVAVDCRIHSKDRGVGRREDHLGRPLHDPEGGITSPVARRVRPEAGGALALGRDAPRRRGGHTVAERLGDPGGAARRRGIRA